MYTVCTMSLYIHLCILYVWVDMYIFVFNRKKKKKLQTIGYEEFQLLVIYWYTYAIPRGDVRDCWPAFFFFYYFDTMSLVCQSGCREGCVIVGCEKNKIRQPSQSTLIRHSTCHCLYAEHLINVGSARVSHACFVEWVTRLILCFSAFAFIPVFSLTFFLPFFFLT